ncbi:MAG: transketolase [Maricaulaceae bacterium]
MANAIRALAMDAVEAAQSGHPGMPMGMADAATALFAGALKFDAHDPHWPDRDRFVLSAGHGSMLLYALLHLTGYEDFPLHALKEFRQLGALTAGHPEFGHGAGVETTTGPLGQGLATAVGLALGERLMAARFGDDLVDHKTYVIASDGDLMEGISQEAIALAGHLKLRKLIVLFDDNGISIDGSTALSDSVDQIGRFQAAGWASQTVDGHDPAAVAHAIAQAQTADRPSLIACKTTIGKFAPTKADTAGAHGAPLGAEEIAGARAAMDWPHAPFDIPADILEQWRAIGARGAEARAAWRARLDAADPERRSAFEAALANETPAGAREALTDLIARWVEDAPAMATRKASGLVLDTIAPHWPTLIGGSADLSGSNNTKAKSAAPVSAEDFSGGYIHYGVREHGMAAAMNGMALHGGITPFGGTFLVFADYCRGAIRLSALMGQRVIYVLTHDSIGLGEDGPTHQPVEHLASLRAMPNLAVFRPADAVETAEAWAAALDRDGPSVIALTRQGVPALRTAPVESALVAKGGYVIRPAEGDAQAVILATGSEVAIAVEAQARLASDGIAARVVSLPCWEVFDAQRPGYGGDVLGGDLPKVAVEAAVRLGWDRFIGPEGGFVGMTGFGASAPAKALYPHFGITADAVVQAVKARV